MLYTSCWQLVNDFIFENKEALVKYQNSVETEPSVTSFNSGQKIRKKQIPKLTGNVQFRLISWLCSK